MGALLNEVHCFISLYNIAAAGITRRVRPPACLRLYSPASSPPRFLPPQWPRAAHSFEQSPHCRPDEHPRSPTPPSECRPQSRSQRGDYMPRANTSLQPAPLRPTTLPPTKRSSRWQTRTTSSTTNSSPLKPRHGLTSTTLPRTTSSPASLRAPMLNSRRPSSPRKRPFPNGVPHPS